MQASISDTFGLLSYNALLIEHSPDSSSLTLSASKWLQEPSVKADLLKLVDWHLQANWRTVRGAVASFPGLEDVRLEDVQHMSTLCPEVVFLQDTQR